MKEKLLFILLLIAAQYVAGQDFNYMGGYDAQGVPDYLDGRDVVTQDFLTKVDNSVPESFPVPLYNPHYITSGYDTDIKVNEDAEVWVTFIKEGAGYRNVLGFYTYDLDNPPTSKPQDSEITIIFPNVSGAGSGGGLIAGDRVKLGFFKAGTGIGWVLLANAWNGSNVGYGHWQLFSNPNFNPEAEETLRYHNVLLSDPKEERIVLGFEDIRRDYASCDQDFNDALFYVTASPYRAIHNVNFAEVNTESPVYSAFDGGLESNGNLSMLIAKRNMQRAKDGVYVNKKEYQSKYRINSGQYKSTVAQDYFPETGMFGTETTYISSPDDLVGITNADDVFAIDYYAGEKRVAAALLTETSGNVYNHTKTICDRLNGSLLEDIRTINLEGYLMIMAQIVRENGSREYAVSFSVKQKGAQQEFMSYWNIAQYPEGNFRNFQVWGSSMGQVSHIVRNILGVVEAEGTLTQTVTGNLVPEVFVQFGYYDAGKIFLRLRNRAEDAQVETLVEYKKHEHAAMETYTQNINIGRGEILDVALPTGYLFDAGIGLYVNGAQVPDHLYLADGPWGIDYDEQGVTLNEFIIEAEDDLITDDDFYGIERGIQLDAQVTTTANVFRHIHAGDLAFDAGNFTSVEFTAGSSLPVEVILVTEDLMDWNDRLRYTIPAQESPKEYSIPFADFKDGAGNAQQVTTIKSIVFSIHGDYVTSQHVTAAIHNLGFSNRGASLGVESHASPEAVTVSNYPNPFTMETTFKIPVQTEEVNLKVYDVNGRMVYQAFHPTAGDKKTIRFKRNGLHAGFYMCQLTTRSGETYKKKVLMN
ncbi:MAG: hypothetical protein CL868_02985 [Cytophagaceae bacterium]|nr:hypothetical protein [Cytophagaceae bacterium]